MEQNEPVPTSAKGMLSVQETALRTGLSRHTIYAWVHQRRIPHAKVGRRVLFEPTEIGQWLEGCKVRPGAAEGAGVREKKGLDKPVARMLQYRHEGGGTDKGHTDRAKAEPVGAVRAVRPATQHADSDRGRGGGSQAVHPAEDSQGPQGGSQVPGELGQD